MIETLIAVLVFSIGLAGYMQLLMVNLKNVDSASYRNQAVILASDIVDRMRTNIDEAMDGAYNTTYESEVAGTDRADMDIMEWRSSLSSSLPAGAGSINCSGPSGFCTVVVRWDDSRATEGDSAEELSTKARLQ